MIPDQRRRGQYDRYIDMDEIKTCLSCKFASPMCDSAACPLRQKKRAKRVKREEKTT